MKIKILIISFFGLLFVSCLDDLDTEPVIELTLEELLRKDPKAIDGILSKMYGSFALSGSNGPDSKDIVGNDAGELAFLRGIVNLQDFTADAMKNRWGDDGLDQLTTTSGWTAENKFFRYLYDRVYFTVGQTSNIVKILNLEVEVPNEQQYVSDLRFLRALSYYYMIDCFGKGVLATENEFGSPTAAPQATRKELYDYVEKELLDIEGKISQTNTYGRANKSVVRMLLAKLYLNAQVYTGTAQYEKSAVYTNKVITEGGYSLSPTFVKNFSGDNNTSPEFIFPLLADPQVSQSFGNTTYIVNGNLNNATMTLANYGATEGWGGHRATKAWYGLFGNLATSTDDRAKLFWTTGHTFEMTDYKEWTNGYPSTKFRNSNSTNTSSATKFSGTDFPLFRLADAYLMYAECALRGASSATLPQALTYVNNVRTRANAATISTGELTLNFIINERGRELNLEGHRRTDLIRFGLFTGGSYLWPWKGNAVNGTSIEEKYNLFPIPNSALKSNPNLTQNPLWIN